MILIASAAYVDSEFQTEFGRLPPSLLPVGNRCLYEHQIEALRHSFGDEDIYLSLPENFELSTHDRRTLALHKVTPVFVPEEMTLAESILFVINSIGEYDGRLRLLHGDTLIRRFPDGPDVLGVARTRDFYNWEIESSAAAVSRDMQVWCGYFSFSNIKRLVRTLTGSRGKFVKAIRQYDDELRLDRAEIDDWIDLGHINTYYKARARITTQRSFNSLTVARGCVTKTGTPSKKIIAEATWFLSLPKDMKPYVPQLIDYDIDDTRSPHYVLEYLCITPLNEIYVHGQNPVYFWENVFDLLNGWFSASAGNAGKHEAGNIGEARHRMLRDKTLDRLDEFAAHMHIDLHGDTFINGYPLPSLHSIAETCIALALQNAPRPGILHGDLCFSNILFDSRANAVKLIDPRGLGYDGAITNRGDIGYDLAKLSHSVVGLYDHIIAGAYECRREKPLGFAFEPMIDRRISAVQELFRDYVFTGSMKAGSYIAETILLFLSMLPLHADNPPRQLALLANALRLYRENIDSGRAA